MFAARNGHEDAVTALIKGGADPKVTNGDGLTATMVAIVNDRFDLAAKMVELGADANDGSLYFAVDMHDATTDMRAHDGSRLRAEHPNKLTSFDLIKLLLDKGADPNKPFQGQVHSTSLCCDPEVNSSPFYRAAIASDVDVLKLMLAKGAKVDWSPAEVKKEGGKAAGRGANANVGKTPLMMTMTGGRGAAFAAGPGFDRIGAPPFREKANRDPLEAMKVLLAAGANPNAKSPDGSTLLHQAVTARQVPIIKALVAAGAKLDAVNKDNLTPLLLAEKPEPVRSAAAAMQQDPGVYKPHRDTREEVIAAAARADEARARTIRRRSRRRWPTRTRTTRRTTRRRTMINRTRPMKKILTGALFVFAGAAVLAAQQTPQTAPRPAVSPAARQLPAASAATSAADAAKYRTWLNQNCVGCHNNRTKSAGRRSGQPRDGEPRQPAAAGGDVGARAPQAGRARHAAAGQQASGRARVRRRSPAGWPARSTARWAGKSTPGRYVVHRLNRTEYGNAMRDLLALDVDVTQLLPSDGADFGFDNIATSLKTSPLLLERYLTAAQRISMLAVGDADVRARQHGISDQPRVHAERLHRRPAARHARRHGRSATSSRPTANTSCRDGSCAASKKATPASKATTCRTRS